MASSSRLPGSQRPFERVPFRDLPEVPRRPHDYARTRPRDLVMKSAPFGDVRVHYREYGEGPPLLLVHGLMTTSYSWRYVYGALGRHYRVIAPDLPGAGRSDKPEAESYAAECLATWIGEFQRELGIHGCLTVGNSLGGYLCMRLALRDGGAFARLVNIHSPALPAARYEALHTALSIPGARRGLARVVRHDPRSWVWRNVHYYDETLKSREEGAEYGDPLATRPGARAFVRYLWETMAPAGFRSFWTELEQRAAQGKAFPTPLMLLYSRMDPLVPPVNGVRLHALLPGSELSWIDDSSHFAHVDTPEPVVAEVLRFLRAEPPRAEAERAEARG
jgi:pimeloyl-ACP methyl ester carboxylesterase